MTDNDMSMARLTDLFDSVQAGMKTIETMQQQWALLTATGTAARGRVTVSINAEGVVIETRFSSGIEKLSFDEIAKAITEAAGVAMVELRRKTAEVMAPVQGQETQIPKLSELAPGAPDVNDLLPVPPQVSTAPPDSPERVETESDTMEFPDAEQLDSELSQSGITDSSW